MYKHRMLIIIPKTDKTIIGVFHEERCIFKDELSSLKSHESMEIDAVDRHQAILERLNVTGINLGKLSAVSAVGGLLRPVEGGTYLVNTSMVHDLTNSYNGRHASNLGGILAFRIAEGLNIPAYVIDPPVVDEMEDVARYSGYPGIERKSIFHALNQKAAARKAASAIGQTYDTINMIVAHIGNGVSIAAHKQGKVIDVNNGLHGDGPFSLERAGTIPVVSLIDLCYSHPTRKEKLLQDLTYHSGLKGYLGIKNVKEMNDLLNQRSPSAQQVIQAMGYQISKEIGAMASVLAGKIDVIVLTGEFVKIEGLTDSIIHQINWISDTLLYPGEADLQALNAGTLRVLREEEEPNMYKQKKEEGSIYEERI